MKHIEMYDTRLFCGDETATDYVRQERWHESPTALADVTCEKCLSHVFTLGQWARNALHRLNPSPRPPRGASVD